MRGLSLTAIAVFVVTVVIGILNGLDLVEFPRDTLLTHVHAGTLGWITLGIVATSFWLFRTADRWLAMVSGSSCPSTRRRSTAATSRPGRSPGRRCWWPSCDCSCGSGGRTSPANGRWRGWRLRSR